MSYLELERRFRQIELISEAMGVLGWDMQTMMPSGGAESRGEQLATLKVMQHELLVDSRMSDWIEAAERDANLNHEQSQNVREMSRILKHASAVPADLVEAASRAGTRCFNVWQSARAESDFQAFRGPLEEVLALSRQVAAAKGDALGLDPYDAMIDAFDPGGTRARINAVFSVLEDELPKMLERVEDRQRSLPPSIPLQGPFPVERQRELAIRLMQAVGFDFLHGRLDVSHHPFCGGSPDDVRITTRYDESSFASAMMGVLHETGHALYERNLPREWRRQPIGAARGMAMHESQSLIIEMQACRSPEFVAFVAPLIREVLGVDGPAFEPSNLLRHYHRVERGLIRVDADEVTYPLHVILRFRLEQALFDDELEVADLPDAWSDGMQALLGTRPTDHRDGCMQDVHWTDGAFGYFPSYTLGAIAAAQLFQAAVDARPDIHASLAAGDFQPLTGWLSTNVHQRGSIVSTDALLTEASGRSFDPKAFLAHLERRYLN